jgi:hypothetical protein
LSAAVLSGGCQCGQVRFTYEGSLGGALGKVTLCHCAQCRKAQGFAVAAAPAQTAGFTVISGKDLIREFESSPGKFRAFCVGCGSPLYSRRAANPAALRLRLGALDWTPEGLRIEAHIFTNGAPAWCFADDAPRHEGPEPDRP